MSPAPPPHLVLPINKGETRKKRREQQKDKIDCPEKILKKGGIQLVEVEEDKELLRRKI